MRNSRALFGLALATHFALGAAAARAQIPLWTCNFTNANWFAEWYNSFAPSGKSGIQFGSSNITRTTDAAAPGGAFLRVTYPAGSYAPSGSPPAPIGGTQFYGGMLHTNGLSPRDALTVQFSVRFPSNFNYVIGGKLPGLYGGHGNTGTDYPDGTDGFTTRHMWRTAGAGEAYPFLPNSPTIYGTSLGRGNWYFSGDSQWHTLRQDVLLNDVGTSNGLIRVWYDGVLVLDAPGLFFRTTDSLKIDGVLFQTFFGGGDTNYATPATAYADFAAFAVYDLTNTGSLTLLENYQATVLAQNPSHYYRFDGSLTNAITGSALSVNGSGGGFGGDYFNNPDLAWFFSATIDALIATNDLVNGGGTPSSSATNKGSLSLLFRSLDSTNNTAQRFIFSQGNTTANDNAFGLFFENNSSSDPNSLKLRGGNTTAAILPPAQILANRWYYFAVTWDEARTSGEIRWFLGPLGGALTTGTLDLSSTAVVGDNGSFYFGNNSGLNNAFRNPGNGRLDEFAFWARELSATELTNQFLAVLPPPPLPVPPLVITTVGTNVVISWSTNGANGYILESTTSLSATNAWSFLSVGALIGDSFRVTNSADLPARFFRLNNP